MRVSVIIPVYDRQALGERALRSARSQDVDDMEVVLVDDASDPPFQLPADLAADPRVRVVRHEVNRGAGRSRDTGVAAAGGDWVAFLDSDDYWLPGTLAPRLEIAERAVAATRGLRAGGRDRPGPAPFRGLRLVRSLRARRWAP